MTVQAIRTAVAVPVLVEVIDAGAYRLRPMTVPGFAAVAHTAADLAVAFERVRREHDIALYAARRGLLSDLVAHDMAAEQVEPEPEPAPAPVHTSPVHRRRPGFDPGTWEPLADGSWLSPSGYRYRAEARQVQQVIERRREAGMPTAFAPAYDAGRVSA